MRDRPPPLRATYVVEASIDDDAGQLLVVARIVNAETDRKVWVADYRGARDDVRAHRATDRLRRQRGNPETANSACRLAPLDLIVVLVVVALPGVVARVLLEIGQRLEAAHAIEEQDAVEMIGLVLDDARREILELELEALAVAIERRRP